ncbi:MAG: hypothetical protein ACYTG6_02160 [Planctomycetota bacterium]|jgi:hypothetical protein
MTYFQWVEASIDALRAVTPAEGEDAEPLTPERHVIQSLGIDRARARGDLRPTLVYFHWPHEDARNGKLSDTLCGRVLDEEHVARWGLLFRCVQVDMADSDERLVSILEAGRRPSFVVVNERAEVIVRIPPVTSSRKFQRALEKALRAFPDAWERLQKALEQQADDMAEARRLLRRDEKEAALELIDRVRFSDVRVGPLFEKARVEGMKLAQEIERELDD